MSGTTVWWSVLLFCLIQGLVHSEDVKPKCYEPSDIIFVLDSSLSITSSNYVKQLGFVSNLTQSFNLGHNDAKFGAIIFSYNVTKLFDLKDYSDHPALSQAIMSAPYLDGGTETALALNYIADNDMFGPRAGGRDNATNILIVMTDGQSHSPTQTASAADRLKKAGVRIISIGIANASLNELQDIASKPSNVFQAATFDVLQYIQDAVINRTCQQSTVQCFETVDIIFVLDASTSVGAPDYKKQLMFASSLTRRFDLGPNEARFGAIVFSYDPLKLFDLKDNSNQNDVSQALLSAPYLEGGTETALALAWISSQGMFSSSSGGRDNATKIVIVMTDGQSHYPQDTALEADRLKYKGVKIISIGIANASLTELNDIASRPDNVFQAASFDVLQQIEEIVINRTCALPQEPEIEVNPQCNPKADIIFVLDASDSVGSVDFEKGLIFVANLTRNFIIGPTNVSFGAVLFSYEPLKLFDLKDYYDHKALSQALLSAPYLTGGTETAEALEFVSSDGMFSSISGGREDAAKIVIAITDGQSHYPTLTAIAADGLKSNGIKILAIGIANASPTELNAIASKPQNVFQVASYDILRYVHDQILNRTCELPQEPESEITPHCYELADVIFVLDSSLSIGIVDYKRQLWFAANVTKNFKVGPNDVNFGAIIFSDGIKELFSLNDKLDHSSLWRKLLNATYLNGGTETAEALSWISNRKMFDTTSGHRENATKILIVMTDGQSHYPTQTEIAADRLKSAGVKIVSIGIANASVSELNTIASKPQNVFQAANYEALHYLQEKVITRTCQLPQEPETGVTPQCFEMADIIFVLDSSLSIGIEDYRRQLWFAANITKNFKLGPKDANFGAIIFSDDVMNVFNLKDKLDHSSLWQVLLSATYLNGGTETAKALSWVSNQRLFDPTNGGRTNATKVVIVMTDGESHYPEQTSAAAGILKGENVKIMSIGIGNASMTELQAIASKPENVFQASSYGVLHHIQEEINKRTCDLPKEPETEGPQCGKGIDIVFVMDASSSITKAEFERQQQFMSGLTRYFKLGPNAVQLAALVFSTSSLIVFDLDDHRDYDDMSKAILAAPYLNSATSTHVALKMVRELVLSPGRGARPGVPKMVIVMTDGHSSSPTMTKSEAQLLQSGGVIMMSITVGNGNMIELEAIASQDTNVFQVDDYDILATIEQHVADSACEQVPRKGPKNSRP